MHKDSNIMVEDQEDIYMGIIKMECTLVLAQTEVNQA